MLRSTFVDVAGHNAIWARGVTHARYGLQVLPATAISEHHNAKRETLPDAIPIASGRLEGFAETCVRRHYDYYV